MSTSFTLSHAHAYLPLAAILCRIVCGGDRHALEEFHRRPLFCLAGGRRVTFAEYAAVQRDMTAGSRYWARWGTSVLDRAYDLLVERFVNLPSAVESPGGGERMSGEVTGGADCRNYFRAFLNGLQKDILLENPLGALEIERFATHQLQVFVKRHFYLCLLESRREANPFVSRYTWKGKDFHISLRFPRQFEGRKRREWLVKHVEAPDMSNPMERERIQSLIDKGLVMPHWVSFSAAADRHEWAHPPVPQDECPDGGDKPVPAIREFIANEKADSIALQRRGIRAIGPERLRSLVLDILNRLDGDTGCDRSLAEQYGLSPATYSRFAGRDWCTRSGNGHAGSAPVPDLFRNIAHVIARRHSEFAAAAKKAGVWKSVAGVASLPKQPRMRIHDYGQ